MHREQISGLELNTYSGKNRRSSVLGDSEAVLKIANGGFYIGCNYGPAKLYELAKMDGAIILSPIQREFFMPALTFFLSLIFQHQKQEQDMCNERTAKQTKELVISISQKECSHSVYRKYKIYS